MTMESRYSKINAFERYMSVIIIATFLFYVAFKIHSTGYEPSDDAHRHVVFAISNQEWSDSLIIAKGLESDHNAGWHSFLNVIHQLFGINKFGLLIFSYVSLFMLFNIVGIAVSPNIAAWFVTLILVAFIQTNFYGRLLSGRPFILSCTTTLLLLKLWFTAPKDGETLNNLNTYLISFIALTLCVWLHGSWYLFLILPASLLIAGQLKKSFYLTLIIVLATLCGAFLTGAALEKCSSLAQATVADIKLALFKNTAPIDLAEPKSIARISEALTPFQISFVSNVFRLLRE